MFNACNNRQHSRWRHLTATTTNSVCILSGVKIRLCKRGFSVVPGVGFIDNQNCPASYILRLNLDVYLGKAVVLEGNTINRSIDND